ncbi:hypothetical protein chiPu_0009900 [Chiloscyllium punctatum]|uniref:Fibronectin type-III domain-containing protein n=1 Tax=Chiloscyllium punctatum TaxID=137246 RepID=A0A401SM25_CHIPU|nr:hypothetical protein [Chiloscyllium punctatum]
MAPFACCLAISFVLPVVLSNTDMQVLKNISELNPPTNLTIVDRQLGEVTISWNDGLSEIIKASTRVRYPFQYKYFDSQTWQEDSRLQESEYRKTFELHRGVSVRIKTMVQDLRKIKKVESDWTVIDIQPPPETKYSLQSINLTERYSVKVRVKSKSTCGENKYWSEWSNEVFIERTLSLNMHWFVHMSVVLVTMVGLLLIFAFGKYRVLEVAFKPIPDPQKKFKALFEEYNGDFQNWMNCQVPVTELDECHPAVIEESPHIEA